MLVLADDFHWPCFPPPEFSRVCCFVEASRGLDLTSTEFENQSPLEGVVIVWVVAEMVAIIVVAAVVAAVGVVAGAGCKDSTG